jgi:ABC-type transporter Mla subunit MlaD
VIRRVHDASAGFEDIVAKVRSGADALNAGVADARAVVNKASAAFDEYKPSIDRAVQNVRELTDKVNGEMYREVMDAVAKAKVGVADAAATLRDARELLERNAPQLDELVANANLAAQQLKLTTVEVRAAPWRLLYQPTKKELENEYLYNSVRQYSEAVGELRQAAEALRAVSARAAEARAAGRDIDQASIDRLTAKLQDAFAQYQEQERRFLQRWTEGTGK